MKMKNIFFFAFPMLFLGACNNSEKAYHFYKSRGSE